MAQGRRADGRRWDGPADERGPVADSYDALVRLIVAPIAGVFRPTRTDDPEGTVAIAPGELIGTLVTTGERVEVRSPFAGELVAVVASAGERLRAGELIAWLRVSDGGA
ncbi:MAG: hypothetical protein ACRD29_05095 [Acidimicrobiales bacterium]